MKIGELIIALQNIFESITISNKDTIFLLGSIDDFERTFQVITTEQNGVFLFPIKTNDRINESGIIRSYDISISFFNRSITNTDRNSEEDLSDLADLDDLYITSMNKLYENPFLEVQSFSSIHYPIATEATVNDIYRLITVDFTLRVNINCLDE